MQGDHRPGSQDLGDISGVIGGQGQVGAIEFRELDRAGVQDRDWELTGPMHDGAHNVQRGVIPRDVDPACACGRQHEPEHRALYLVAAVRAMLRAHSGHLHGASARGLELDF